MALAWSGLVMGYGVLILVLIPLTVIPDQYNGYCGSVDHPTSCPNVAFVALAGLAVAAVGLSGVAAGVGLLRARWWARPAVIVTYSLWALGAVAGLVRAAFFARDLDVEGVLMAFLLLACFATVVALAAGSRPRTGSAQRSSGE